MSILTLAEYKATPFYAAAQTDAQINYFLNIIDTYIEDIRGVKFFTFTADSTDLSATLESVSDEYDWLFIGGLIEDLVNGYVRGKVTNINTDDAEITIDTAASGTDTSITLTIYPRRAHEVAAEMISYLISGLSVDKNKKSESIGTYSYTNFDSIDSRFGFPKSIMYKIEQFQSAK